MSNKNQRGFIHILIPLLLIVGLVVGVFLIRNTQVFKSKALFEQPDIGNNTNYDINVLVLKYFPQTTDGKIDKSITGDVGDDYSVIKQRTIDVTNNLIDIVLPKATTYLNSGSPALNYKVIDTKEFNNPVPMLSDGSRKPDYKNILASNGICDYVRNNDVKEVWIWAYQGPNYPNSDKPYLAITESKMSGPYGDVSNSERLNDMPFCGKTYTVETFNYGRGTGEAFHSWGHQVEAELKAVDPLMFSFFQGSDAPRNSSEVARCGSVHFPPNSGTIYDYSNTSAYQSDCLDWNPDAEGEAVPYKTSEISCHTWNDSNFIGAQNPQCHLSDDMNNSQLNYLVWMWQHLPGRDNILTSGGIKLRNWWDIHGDFDKVVSEGKTLLLAPRILKDAPTIFDNFDRDDNPVSLGTTSSGQAWKYSSGNFGIKDGVAYVTDQVCNACYAILDGEKYDGILKVSVPVNPEGTRVIFRYQDNDDYYFVERASSGYELHRVLAGIDTSIASDNQFVTPEDKDELSVNLFGSDIQVYVNGQLVMVSTDAMVLGTKFGFGTADHNTGRFDNFSFTAYQTESVIPPSPTPGSSLTPITLNNCQVNLSANGQSGVLSIDHAPAKVVLTWTSFRDADGTLSASGNWGPGTVDSTGATDVYPESDGSYIYNLNCIGANHVSVRNSVAVFVGPQPSVGKVHTQ